MQFTIVDGVVALVILVSAMLAYNRGLTREAMAIGGWIAAAFAAFYFAPMVTPLVLEIPFVKDVLEKSCTLTTLAAFAIVFAIALVILSIFTPWLSAAVHSTFLGPFDRAFGFLFGVVRGVALIAVLYLLYDTLVTGEADRLAMIDQSFSRGFITDAANALKEAAPTEMPDWLQRRVDQLMGDCGPAGAAGANDAALSTPFSAT